MARPDLFAALGAGSFAHRMGLTSVDPRVWFAARSEPDRIALRRAVFEAHPERLAIACERETLAPIVDWLRSVGVRGERFEDQAAAIASDLLIVRRESPELVAIAVALPSGWAPERALGRPVDSIHAIVPGLDASLGPRIDTFLRRLEDGRAYARANVGLARGDSLDRHPDSHAPALVAGASPDEVVVRVEEQLFLGVSGLVLFAVHLAVRRLNALDPEERSALGEWLASMSDDVAAYKGLAAVRSDLVDHLRAR